MDFRHSQNVIERECEFFDSVDLHWIQSELTFRVNRKPLQSVSKHLLDALSAHRDVILARRLR